MADMMAPPAIGGSESYSGTVPGAEVPAATGASRPPSAEHRLREDDQADPRQKQGDADDDAEDREHLGHVARC